VESECCGNCIYFVRVEGDKHFGYCVGEVPAKMMKDSKRCRLFYPRPGFDPLEDQEEGDGGA